MGSTTQTSVQRWLKDQCESSGLVAGGLVIRAGNDNGAPLTVAEWPDGGAMTAPLTAAAQAAVTRSRPLVVTSPGEGVDTGAARHNRLLSMPLVSGDRTLGAVALAVDASDGNTLNALFDSLTRASAGIGDRLAAGDAVADRSGDAARVLQLQDRFLRHARLADGATALLGELAPLLGSDRISLGVVGDGGIEVVAISNSAEFKAGQELMRLLAAAMQEAADQGERVVYPVATTDPIRIVLAHAELHDRTGQHLASVPMVHDGRVAGALLAEWRGSTPPNAGQIDFLESLGCALGPLVALRQRAERRWTTHAGEWLSAARSRLLRRDDPLPKIGAALLLALLVVMLALPVTYRIGAPARIEGAVQRIVAAPLDGYLTKTHVRPGDSVRAGDVLVELADQDLLLEQRRWEGALAQHENAYAAALARADRAQFVITQGKAGEARAQLDLVRQQLARTRLLAPIDGVVIKGDLSQGLGAPVQRGDALITLAPAEQYRLIVHVDERDVAAVAAGQTGRLALASSPAEPLAFIVERVTPVASVQDGRNAFDVEARLSEGGVPLRPGLQGVAKIDAGERSIAWIWTHRALDWLRLTIWSWTG